MTYDAGTLAYDGGGGAAANRNRRGQAQATARHRSHRLPAEGTRRQGTHCRSQGPAGRHAGRMLPWLLGNAWRCVIIIIVRILGILEDNNTPFQCFAYHFCLVDNKETDARIAPIVTQPKYVFITYTRRHIKLQTSLKPTFYSFKQ